MKFIVDAQLPTGIAWILNNRGFDAIHTDDLPDKERTTDTQIRRISETDNRIVITKDSDFADSYYLNGVPKKLLLITTGNINNKDLYTRFANNINQIISLFETCDFIEMNNNEILEHV